MSYFGLAAGHLGVAYVDPFDSDDFGCIRRQCCVRLEDLRKEEVRERLSAVWLDPLSLDPARRSAKVTREIADQLAKLAKSLEATGHSPQLVSSFLMRALFTMFAEDVGLLPERSFTELLQRLKNKPDTFAPMLEHL